MNEQLRSENQSALATIASYITFPYLWLGLFVFLGWLYKIGFFGRELGSLIVPGLLCLALLSPVVPLTLTRFVVKPIFSNMLNREMIAAPGCLTALVSVGIAFFAILYFLSRGVFETAGLLFLAAPVVAALLAGGVSLLAHGGGLHLPTSRGRTAPGPPAIKVEKPSSHALPATRKPRAISAEERPALPSSQSRPSRSPTPRRSKGNRTSSAPSSRRPPPRRKP